jgi:hypothetical protein
MVMEKQVVFKDYVRTQAQIKTFIGAQAGEVIESIKLDNGLSVVTKVEAAPLTTRTYYHISLPDARSALGFVNGEDFYGDPVLSTDVTITSMRRLV